MTEQAKDPKAPLSRVRANLWALVVIFAIVFAGVRLAHWLPSFANSPYAAYARGSLTKLSFKFAGEHTPRVAINGPSGGQITLQALRGRVILVNLWATWCPPCLTELPSLDKLEAELGSNKFQVVTINMDAAPPSVAEAYLKERGLTHLPLFTDPHLLMDPALAGPGIPASVLYDRKGHEIARMYGAADWSSPEARALIAAAIASTKDK